MGKGVNMWNRGKKEDFRPAGVDLFSKREPKSAESAPAYNDFHTMGHALENVKLFVGTFYALTTTCANPHGEGILPR
jgi:hypothetical protein